VAVAGSDYLLEVDGENVVRSLKPDFGALARSGRARCDRHQRAAASSYDFVSRFFRARAGVNEDP